MPDVSLQDNHLATSLHLGRVKDQPLRIALYSHDTVGLGHTRRNLAIAQVLSSAFPNASLLLLTGSALSGQFDPPPRVDFLTLPALAKDASGLYEARALEVSLKELVKLRSKAIKAALRAFKPDVFIVDNVPTGAAGELIRSLEHMVRKGKTRMVLGLRDILDAPGAVRRQWAQSGFEAAIDRYFDAVWVYGDKRVYDQAKAYGFTQATAAKLRYLGYFDGRARLTGISDSGAVTRILRPELGKLVLAQVGGGEDGEALARTFARTELPAGYYGVLLTGPYMSPELRRTLRSQATSNPRLQVMEFLKEPAELLQHADRVIAMGGYNTTFETLSFEKPLLTVPRVAPRLEQHVRAEALAARGLLDLLHPQNLTERALRRWLERARPAPIARSSLDFGATERLVQALCAVLPNQPLPNSHQPNNAISLTSLEEVCHVAA